MDDARVIAILEALLTFKLVTFVNAEFIYYVNIDACSQIIGGIWVSDISYKKANNFMRTIRILISYQKKMLSEWGKPNWHIVSKCHTNTHPTHSHTHRHTQTHTHTHTHTETQPDTDSHTHRHKQTNKHTETRLPIFFKTSINPHLCFEHFKSCWKV